jgi:hypothetical protein
VDEQLAELARARGWVRHESIPAGEVLHRERLYDHCPVRDAWQWSDGPRRIVCGEVDHIGSIISVDGVDRLPDCDVTVQGLRANPFIWGNTIDPADGTWPMGWLVYSTAADAARVRRFLDVELVELLNASPRWSLRVRSGRAVLQTTRPGRGPGAWQKRLAVIEALIVRDERAGRRPGTAPRPPRSSPNGHRWSLRPDGA